MKEFLRMLFPNSINYWGFSIIMLITRIAFAGLFLTHGLQKIINFNNLKDNFPSPIGLNSVTSLSLVIFAEFFCSIAVIFGLFYRLALIPMIFAMGVATFIVNAGQGLSQQELSLLYFLIFIIMFLLGGGKFTIDNIIRKNIM